MKNNLTVINTIENRIFLIRGQKVMIDRDLADLYGVETKKLNQAVKRNFERFPIEFMFKLTDSELSELVTNCDRFKSLKHSVSSPYAFTEHGIAMLSSVLNSKKAVAINIEIIKAFIRMKRYILEHKDLVLRIDELEQFLIQYAKETNIEIDKINKAIDLLMDRTKPVKIGFRD